MAENEAGSDKTEVATPKKREDSRKEGQVCVSQELTKTVILLVGVFFLSMYAPGLTRNLEYALRVILTNAASIEISFDTIPAYSVWLMITIFKSILPAMLTLAVVAYLITFAQVGPLIKPLKVDIKKLNPISKLKQLGSSKTLVKFVVDFVKLIIISVLVWKTIKKGIPDLMSLADMELRQIMLFTGQFIYWLLIKIFFFIFIVSIFDYAYQKWKYEEDLKMTKQEVQDEIKSREGDPKVKAKIRQIQMQMARQRMFQAIPEADVVITNPIHYAIAIKYDMQSMAAPKVVAKGARNIAQKIKDIARENNVPIVENKPLARALYKSVEIDGDVPEKLYQAVAEILAYVYQLNKQKMSDINKQFEAVNA